MRVHVSEAEVPVLDTFCISHIRSDRYIISLSPHLHTPFPHFPPSLISLMVSVDVKHHAYLLVIIPSLISLTVPVVPVDV